VTAKPPATTRPSPPAAAKPAREPEPPLRSLDDIDVTRATARVKAWQEKFGKALEQPEVCEQMVRHIRALLHKDGGGR
jgi:hypothetical protein